MQIKRFRLTEKCIKYLIFFISSNSFDLFVDADISPTPLTFFFSFFKTGTLTDSNKLIPNSNRSRINHFLAICVLHYKSERESTISQSFEPSLTTSETKPIFLFIIYFRLIIQLFRKRSFIFHKCYAYI